MFLARVVGNLVASVKYPSLTGIKLVVLQPLDVHLRKKGKMVIATDSMGTGYGETVMVVTSKEAAIPHKDIDPLVSSDHCVVGVVDRVDLTGACDICSDITCPREPGGKNDLCQANKTRKKITGKAQKITKKAQKVTGKAQQVTGKAQQVTGKAQKVTGKAQQTTPGVKTKRIKSATRSAKSAKKGSRT